jgi:uncharacterized protein DUF4262
MAEHKREAALAEIRRNIAEHGFHVYVVSGGPCPHYGYTIGLLDSLGAELVLAGAYFYKLDEASSIIRNVSRSLTTPLIPAKNHEVSSEQWGTFSLRAVDLSWSKGLMLGVFDYYQIATFSAYQIVPDKAHLTIDVPDLADPWVKEEGHGWRWLYEAWPYPIPKNSVALTDLDALRGKRITELMRWEEDEWEMFSGPGPDFPESELRIVPLGVLLAADSSLVSAVQLPVGKGLSRDAGRDWHSWNISRDGEALT